MENEKKEPFDYERAKQKVREQFRTGKSLYGKDGAFAPLLQDMINSILEGEMEGHLDQEERSAGNRKNGKGKKLLKTSSGNIEVNTPRDRSGTFEPEMVKKRETIMAQTLEDKIIGLYSLGTSLRDISAHIKETYDTDISATTLSVITDKVIPHPNTEVQTCVVHQICNSLKYVASKDQKVFMTELKPVYRADNEPVALDELAKLKEKWNKKYPMVISSWEKNWPKLSTYFKYPAGIRKLIYTTNTIEGYHRQIRKVTKNKGVFTSDMALLKLMYLATERISQKWTAPLHNWWTSASQLKIIFGDRMKTDL